MPYINSFCRLHGDFPTTVLNLGTSITYLGDNLGLRNFYLESTYILNRTLGPKKASLFGLAMCSCGLAISAAWANPYYIVFCYGLMQGMGCGILALISLWPCWSYFGSSNAKVNGLVLVGYSLGPGLLGLAFTHLANPNNRTPISYNGNDEDLRYPDEVSERVQSSLLIIGASVMIIGSLSLMIISEKKIKESSLLSLDKSPFEWGYKQIFTSQIFWRIIVILYFQYFIMGFFVNNYKVILLNRIPDDDLVAYAGTLCFVANVVGRIVWSAILDFCSFKVTSTMINITGIFLTITLPFIWDVDVLLISWTCMIFFVCSGLYPAFLIEVARSFNMETTRKVLPLTTIPITASVFTCAFIQEFISTIGLQAVLNIVAGLVVIDQIIVFFWNISKETKDKEDRLDIEIDIDIVSSPEISKSINA